MTMMNVEDGVWDDDDNNDNNSIYISLIIDVQVECLGQFLIVEFQWPPPLAKSVLSPVVW